jgi:hypothetical protein
VQELSEFWWATVLQLGTEGPTIIEVPLKAFFSLNELNKAVSSVRWRGATGKSRLGESLTDTLQLVKEMLEGGQLDAVHMLVLSNGRVDQEVDGVEAFVEAKNAVVSAKIVEKITIQILVGPNRLRRPSPARQRAQLPHPPANRLFSRPLATLARRQANSRPNGTLPVRHQPPQVHIFHPEGGDVAAVQSPLVFSVAEIAGRQSIPDQNAEVGSTAWNFGELLRSGLD